MTKPLSGFDKLIDFTEGSKWKEQFCDTRIERKKVRNVELLYVYFCEHGCLTDKTFICFKEESPSVLSISQVGHLDMELMFKAFWWAKGEDLLFVDFIDRLEIAPPNEAIVKTFLQYDCVLTLRKKPILFKDAASSSREKPLVFSVKSSEVEKQLHEYQLIQEEGRNWRYQKGILDLQEKPGTVIFDQLVADDRKLHQIFQESKNIQTKRSNLQLQLKAFLEEKEFDIGARYDRGITIHFPHKKERYYLRFIFCEFTNNIALECQNTDEGLIFPLHWFSEEKQEEQLLLEAKKVVGLITRKMRYEERLKC